MADKHSRILRVYQHRIMRPSEMLEGVRDGFGWTEDPKLIPRLPAPPARVLKYRRKRSRAYTNSTEKFPGPDLLVSDVDAGPHQTPADACKVSDRAADSYAELIQSRPDTTAMNMDPRESITHFSVGLTTSNVPESTIYDESTGLQKCNLKPEVMPSQSAELSRKSSEIFH
jgi:hypothetical protein